MFILLEGVVLYFIAIM